MPDEQKHYIFNFQSFCFYTIKKSKIIMQT